jgi:predicted ATPase
MSPVGLGWNLRKLSKAVKVLRLQDLTHDDIRLYVNNKLTDNTQMQELCVEDPAEAPKLVDEIVHKAQGVSLWVKLVVRSLMDGLTNGDHILDLQGRLREFPSEL